MHPWESVANIRLRCAICGNTSTQPTICHSVLVGNLKWYLTQDLGGQIPPQLQACPRCGYCALNISKADKEAKAFVQGDRAYQALRRKIECPALARDLLCLSLVLAREGQWPAAGWSAVRASWQCPRRPADADLAWECRSRAAKCFAQSLRSKQTFANGQVEQALILSDLQRLCGMFGEAERSLVEGGGGVISLYQSTLALIRAQDKSRPMMPEQLLKKLMSQADGSAGPQGKA